MEAPQNAVVNHEAETYSFTAVSARTATRSGNQRDTRRAASKPFWPGEGSQSLWMVCSDCYPGMVTTFAPLRKSALIGQRHRLMELTARLGSVMSYRRSERAQSFFY